MPTAALSMRDMTHWYVPDYTVLDGADLTVAPASLWSGPAAAAEPRAGTGEYRSWHTSYDSQSVLRGR